MVHYEKLNGDYLYHVGNHKIGLGKGGAHTIIPYSSKKSDNIVGNYADEHEGIFNFEKYGKVRISVNQNAIVKGVFMKFFGNWNL